MIFEKTIKVSSEISYDIDELKKGKEIFPKERDVYLEILRQKLRDAIVEDIKAYTGILKKMHDALLRVGFAIIPLGTTLGDVNSANDMYNEFITRLEDKGKNIKSEKEAGK